MIPSSPRRTTACLLSLWLAATLIAAGCAKDAGTVNVSSAELASSGGGDTTTSSDAGAAANDTAVPDDTEPGTTVATVTATSRRSPNSTTTEGPTTSTTSGSTQTTKRGSDTTLGSPVAEYAEWCNALRTGFLGISAMPSGTAAEEETLFTAAKALFSALAVATPPAIRQDWALINEHFQGLTSTTAGTTPKPVSAAEDRIEAWVKPNCGFDLNDL